MAKDKRKKDDWDDGRTIAPMNGDELPYFRRLGYTFRKKRPSKEEREKMKNQYTRKERRAIMRAGFLSLLPFLGIVLGAFAVVGVFMWLWLK